MMAICYVQWLVQFTKTILPFPISLLQNFIHSYTSPGWELLFCYAVATMGVVLDINTYTLILVPPLLYLLLRVVCKQCCKQHNEKHLHNTVDRTDDGMIAMMSQPPVTTTNDVQQTKRTQWYWVCSRTTF